MCFPQVLKPHGSHVECIPLLGCSLDCCIGCCKGCIIFAGRSAFAGFVVYIRYIANWCSSISRSFGYFPPCWFRKTGIGNKHGRDAIRTTNMLRGKRSVLNHALELIQP